MSYCLDFEQIYRLFDYEQSHIFHSSKLLLLWRIKEADYDPTIGMVPHSANEKVRLCRDNHAIFIGHSLN